MKPLRLRASGFRTFADLDLSFQDGLVGILGELRDAPGGASSNGAGKSSILEAIDIALFGRRSLAGFLTRGGDVDTLTIELEFSHAGDVYRVRRSYKRGKSAKVDFEQYDQVAMDGSYETLSRETTKQTDAAIIEVLNLTRATFRDSGYLRQGGGSYADPARDPKERLDLLVEAALGRDPVWPKVLDAARAARKAAEGSLERLAGETAAARELVATKAEVVDLHRQAGLTEAVFELKLVEGERALQKTVEAYQAARDTAALRQVAEAEARQAVDAHQRAKMEFDAATMAATLLADKTIELQEVAADASRVAGLESAVAQLRVDAVNLQNALAARELLVRDADGRERAREQMVAQAQQLVEAAKIQRDKADHLDVHASEAEACDRCGQTLGIEAAGRAALSYRDEADKFTLNAETILEACENEAETIGELRRRALAVQIPNVDETRIVTAEAELATARAAAEQSVRLFEQVRQLTEKAARRLELEAASVSAASSVVEKTEALEAIEPVDLAAIEAAGATARRAVAQRRMDLDEAKVQRGRLDEKLAAIATAEERVAELGASSKTLQASIDVESVIEKACGRAGIPTLILEAVVIPTLEQKAAHILAELGTGYRVELRTQKANQDGGLRDTCEAVVIDQNGHEAEFSEGISWGQKTRVALALQLALAEYLASKPGAETTFLAIDEPQFLDPAGTTALLGLVQDLLARRLFEMVMVVTQHTELRDSIENNILVVMEGGISRIDGDRSGEQAGQIAAVD